MSDGAGAAEGGKLPFKFAHSNCRGVLLLADVLPDAAIGHAAVNAVGEGQGGVIGRIAGGTGENLPLGKGGAIDGKVGDSGAGQNWQSECENEAAHWGYLISEDSPQG